MSKLYDVIEGTLASAIATGGTLTVSYPTNRDDGDYAGGYAHELYAAGGVYKAGVDTDADGDFDISIAFGTSVVVTYNGLTTLPAGTRYTLGLHRAGDSGAVDALADTGKMARGEFIKINLGAPLTADTDAMIKAATSTESPNAETVTYTPDTDGTSPTDGAAGTETVNGVLYWKLDVPRNILSTVTHGSSVVAMTITVTGLDIYGKTLVETITVAATGTSQVDNGLAAFKHIRSIALTAAADAEANTVNVGWGDVLGLPCFLPQTGDVLSEQEDGVEATAGTLVAGSVAVQTATSGDVRGTYDPNSACDGAKDFQLLAWVADPSYKGLTPYAG